MSFSFSFSGDDIEDDPVQGGNQAPPSAADEAHHPALHSAATGASAFPVRGKPLLEPRRHELSQMLASLPSKIAFGTLDIDLDQRATIQLPRRELWDVRVQLMAEEGAEDERGDGKATGELEPGLGKHDVKTGIYEGGFKSWESSIDLVKVLAAEDFGKAMSESPCRVIELGCGTALPSLALFLWAGAAGGEPRRYPLSLTMADYNPSVLYLVTLPNFILAWALLQKDQSPALKEAFSEEGELELTPEVLEAFQNFLTTSGISLSFLSGAWSPEFIDLVYQPGGPISGPAADGVVPRTLVVGAETIYSPFALDSFTETLLSVLNRERARQPGGQAAAVVAAKRLYFGVGGSLDDFVDKIRSRGAVVNMVREETEGVRRGVVQLFLPSG